MFLILSEDNGKTLEDYYTPMGISRQVKWSNGKSEYCSVYLAVSLLGASECYKSTCGGNCNHSEDEQRIQRKISWAKAD